MSRHTATRAGVCVAVLLLSACARMPGPVVEAPVVIGTVHEDRIAQTVCSINNRPLVVVDSMVPWSLDAELVYRHEQTHADDMDHYKGGCWPFLYRYTRDRLFRIAAEMKAYCTEGRLALQRNRRPELVWARIVAALARDTLLTDRDNCLYGGGA